MAEAINDIKNKAMRNLSVLDLGASVATSS
jgi:hypothetical protein